MQEVVKASLALSGSCIFGCWRGDSYSKPGARGADVPCLQKSRVRGQPNLPSTASNMEPQSKINEETKAHGPTRLEFAASSSKKGQVQGGLGSTRTFSKDIPGCLHRGLLQNPPFLQDFRGTVGSQACGYLADYVQHTYTSRAEPPSMTPSSDGFGILEGSESWSLFQTSYAGADSTRLLFLVVTVVILQPGQSLDAKIQRFLSDARKHVISVLMPFIHLRCF